ncbi:MAG: hypothetical protein Q9M13_00015, partial [Mariprofundales bacterium]|nr:hypothetical protein [Mariprofundales bacterium]
MNPVGTLDRVFEVISTRFDEITGNVVLEMEAQPVQSVMQALAQSFFPADAQRSVSAAYSVGTPYGAAGAYTIPDGDTLGVIDNQTTYYHSGGNLTLLAGQTLNIAGSVVLYVDGVFDIQGTINGYATGASGAPEGSNGNPNGWPYGNAPANSGYTGRGGTGATVGASGGRGFGAVRTNAARHPLAPAVTPVLQTTTSITGVPTEALWGGGGGTSGNDLKAGGNGGAGLVIICRGI